MFASLRNWIKRSKRGARVRPGSRRQLVLEALEERLVPATILWDNRGDDNFEVFNNLPAQSAFRRKQRGHSR